MVVGVALRGLVTHTGTVSSLAADRAIATVELVVTGDPRPMPPRSTGFGPVAEQVIVPARLEQVDARGHRWGTRVPVVVLASADAWSALLPSQHLRADVRLAPSRPGDATAALLVARGPPTAVGPPSQLQRLAGHLRAGLRGAVGRLPVAERGLAAWARGR